MGKKISLSALQPSGKVTLGNYLGAIKNWVDLQEHYDGYYCLADLHAMTMLPEPEKLRELTLEGLAVYLSSGLDPEQSTIFLQSQISEHAELAWILSCFTSMGELNRMTQFKDKSAQKKQVGVGLFTYPVLMAADILLYQADVVPVGADQKQHLELTRDLAIRFNNRYKTTVFKVPEPLIQKQGARIMSLSDPTKKMSKSDEDLNATVFVTDDEKTILKKFKKAVTDSETSIHYDVDQKAGVSNLLTIQSVISGKSIVEIEKSYQGKMYGHLKVETGEIVCAALETIRTKFQEFLTDRGELERILQVGRAKAKEKASQTLESCFKKTGIRF